jgi:hypothetical protein
LVSGTGSPTLRLESTRSGRVGRSRSRVEAVGPWNDRAQGRVKKVGRPLFPRSTVFVGGGSLVSRVCPRARVNGAAARFLFWVFRNVGWCGQSRSRSSPSRKLWTIRLRHGWQNQPCPVHDAVSAPQSSQGSASTGSSVMGFSLVAGWAANTSLPSVDGGGCSHCRCSHLFAGCSHVDLRFCGARSQRSQGVCVSDIWERSQWRSHLFACS